MRSLRVALLAEGVDRNPLGGEVITGVSPSSSSRRAWIEITACTWSWTLDLWSSSSRRAWIEIVLGKRTGAAPASSSSRRAWIEIRMLAVSAVSWNVVLLAEGVDRNDSRVPSSGLMTVVLLAEGVDRN